MIIPSDFLDCPSTLGLAAALYLDAYTNADATVVYLPKRKYDEVRNPKRIPYLPFWTRYLHTSYLAVPDQWPLHQYVILDDGWALATFQIVAKQFASCKEQAMRVALYLWERILFWQQYSKRPYSVGFVTTHERTAEVCGCSVEFANKVTLAMIDADLIHRKWIGNGLGHFGTCYMAGPANNVDNLLSSVENPI